MKKQKKLVSVCDGKTLCPKRYYGSKNTKTCCKTPTQLKKLSKKQRKSLKTMGCCNYRKFAKSRALPYKNSPKFKSKQKRSRSQTQKNKRSRNRW